MKGSASWATVWWVRGQTVGTVVGGQSLFDGLRPRPTPLACNVYEVEVLLLSVLLLSVLLLSVLQVCRLS